MSLFGDILEVVKVGAPIAMRILADQVDDEKPTRDRHQMRSVFDTEVANARHRLALRREQALEKQ